MLLRGGKTVEKLEFLQDSNFQLLFTVILYVKKNVCNFHLSIFLFAADADLISMCVDFSLDSVRIGRYGTRFSRMF